MKNKNKPKEPFPPENTPPPPQNMNPSVHPKEEERQKQQHAKSGPQDQPAAGKTNKTESDKTKPASKKSDNTAAPEPEY